MARLICAERSTERQIGDPRMEKLSVSLGEADQPAVGETPRISFGKPAGRGADLITASLGAEGRKYFDLTDSGEPS
jgi:hypothetical protein